MARWMEKVRVRLAEMPRLALALGGTLVVVIIAVVAIQVRRPTEGVAQVGKSRTVATTGGSSGSARVGSAGRGGQVARIINASGVTKYISHDELARECIMRVGAEVLDEMINRSVIRMACTEQGIKVTQPEIEQEVIRLCKETGTEPSSWYEILRNQYKMTPEQYHQTRIWPNLALKKLVGKTVQVTEAELQEAYEHHFGPRVKVRLIVYRTRRRADKGWNLLRRDPAEFERIAMKDSTEPSSRSLGGRIPPIRRHSQHPQLEAAAFRLKVGEISAIIQYGQPSRYAILKCEGHTESDVKMAEARSFLLKQLQDSKSQQSMARYVGWLKDRTRVDNFLLNKTTGRTARRVGYRQPANKAISPKSGPAPLRSTRTKAPPPRPLVPPPPRAARPESR